MPDMSAVFGRRGAGLTARWSGAAARGLERLLTGGSAESRTPRGGGGGPRREPGATAGLHSDYTASAPPAEHAGA